MKSEKSGAASEGGAAFLLCEREDQAGVAERAQQARKIRTGPLQEEHASFVRVIGAARLTAEGAASFGPPARPRDGHEPFHVLVFAAPG
jgi:hypothetical protein